MRGEWVFSSAMEVVFMVIKMATLLSTVKRSMNRICGKGYPIF